MKAELNEKWIKASIIGTIWVASEIVLGSFLHNLKIPFSGNILTAIGIIILISVSYTWSEKGLFWRAGLICTIMKTMSPSAVIYGSMIPDFKSLIRNPVSIFFEVISNANTRLSEIKNKIKSNPRVYIITGKISSGKTTYAKKLVVELKKRNVLVGGIISEKVLSDSQVSGYDLIDIETNESEILLRRSDEPVKERIGRFGIFAGGFEKGKAILTRVRLSDNIIIIIDEVGVLELGDKGWSGCLAEILRTSNKQLLIIVRENLIEEVIRKWNLSEPVVFKVTETDYLTASDIIMNNLSV